MASWYLQYFGNVSWWTGGHLTCKRYNDFQVTFDRPGLIWGNCSWTIKWRLKTVVDGHVTFCDCLHRVAFRPMRRLSSFSGSSTDQSTSTSDLGCCSAKVVRRGWERWQRSSRCCRKFHRAVDVLSCRCWMCPSWISRCCRELCEIDSCVMVLLICGKKLLAVYT